MSQANERVRILQRLPDGFWDGLIQTPWRYDLFQLLRRIDAQGGEKYPLGRAPQPRHEPLRIGQTPSLAFAPSTLSAVSAREGSPLHDVSILSFGLFGPNGPLPIHMTEYARERVYHYQDSSLTAFADLFHHRLTLLFYRAWADAQPTVSLDRADGQRFDRYLACLIGMGQPAQRTKGCLSEHARLMMAGHLSRHGRDAEGLEKVLQHYFGVPVRIEQNVAQWLTLDVRERARLATGRQMPRLGETTFLGIAVRDVQHKLRINIGPLSLERYNAFLPGERHAKALRDWVRQYLGVEYVWEARLVLASEEVSGATLGGEARLGYSSWIGYQPTPQPRGDLVFNPEK
jgi:type VI secretion system protein ImpH